MVGCGGGVVQYLNDNRNIKICVYACMYSQNIIFLAFQ